MTNKANIIIMLADDMGFSDIGCFGSEIYTPCLDTMAEKGIRYSHMYNNARAEHPCSRDCILIRPVSA